MTPDGETLVVPTAQPSVAESMVMLWMVAFASTLFVGTGVGEGVAVAVECALPPTTPGLPPLCWPRAMLSAPKTPALITTSASTAATAASERKRPFPLYLLSLPRCRVALVRLVLVVGSSSLSYQGVAMSRSFTSTCRIHPFPCAPDCGRRADHAGGSSTFA